MNNIHKIIFNKNTQQFVVVSELSKSAGKAKAISADTLDIASLLQNFSEKRPLVDFSFPASGQILQKTGKFRSLVFFAEQFNLRVGIALSPEQVANLTSDIVWLESESVTLPNGKVEQVLVPKVYALAQKGDITGKGALLSGNQVTHRSGELINSGTIAGRELVQLDSQKVKNTGTISGSAILGNITGDLANLGGTLEADRAILLNVSGNLTHSSTLHTTEVNNNGYQRSETTIGRKGLMHVKGKDGILQLRANNLDISGAEIINDGQGQTYLSAKNQLNLTALQTGFDEKMGGGEHYRNQAIQDVNVSRVKGNGNVILKGGSIYSEGADIDAKARLALIAENDIVLGGATRQTAFEEYHKTKSGSAVAKKTETRHANSGSKTQIGTVLSADNIVLSAGQDVTASASQIVADNDIRIVAGNNVSITAGTNYFKDTYQESKKISGAFTNGGLGITIGKRKENLEQDYTQQSAARTLLGSLSGNITIQADNHYQQTGSIITARDGNVDITAKSANITAARSDYESNYKRTTEQKGGAVAFSSPVTNTIQAVKNSVNSAKVVGSSKNDRINALGAVNAGFEAMRTAEQVGQLAEALIQNPTQALTQNVSVSITYGEQKSVETQHSEGNKVEKSQINAGGKVNINTKGDGKNSILTIAGSDVSGKGGTHLKAEGGVNMLAVDENHLKRSQNESSGFNAGVAIQFDNGGSAGITAGGNEVKMLWNGVVTASLVKEVAK